MKKIKVKYVDTYDKFYNLEVGQYLEERYDIEYTDEPDFLFYGVYRTGREHYKYKNCVKIFMSSEGVLPNFNECDYAIGCYPMNVSDRYLQIPMFYPEESQKEPRNYDKSALDRKFCNFIYSNENNGKGAILRKQFCEALQNYKHVDCPGKVLNNMSNAIEPRNGNWFRGKEAFIKDYKFTIAFENVSMPGMITEKIEQPMRVGSVPIYYGAEDVADYYNEKAFINCNDCNSIEEMVEKVKEVDSNDDLYMHMLNEPIFKQDVITNYGDIKREFLYKIIEKGNNEIEKNPLHWDSGIKAAEYIVEKEQNILFKFFNRNLF